MICCERRHAKICFIQTFASVKHVRYFHNKPLKRKEIVSLAQNRLSLLGFDDINVAASTGYNPKLEEFKYFVSLPLKIPKLMIDLKRSVREQSTDTQRDLMIHTLIWCRILHLHTHL